MLEPAVDEIDVYSLLAGILSYMFKDLQPNLIRQKRMPVLRSPNEM